MNVKQIVYNQKFHPDITIYGKDKASDNVRIARDVIAGKYGVGAARIAALEKAGYDYSLIQAIVNDILTNKNYAQIIGFEEKVSSAEILSVLQSMQFTLSVNDISGSFSLTLFPEIGNDSLFDKIKVLDIVVIKEAEKPVFTGIVKRKTYVAQTNDNGGLRRISISGTAVTGLVSQFLVNLDTAAMAITNQIASDVSLAKDLTLKMTEKENIAVSEVVKTIWEYFIKIASQNGTPEVADYIRSLLGDVDNFFMFDESTFFYPLGCIFKGQQTQDFFSIVDGVIPSPVYEKFARMASDGKMKIVIRKVPFDADKWAGDKTTNPIKHTLDAKLVKGLTLALSDNEVYTVFYAYLNNSPIDEQKSLILSTMENKKDNVLVDSDKYRVYGYKPMIAHFIGYGKKDGSTDNSSQSEMQKMSEKLKEWYEKLPEMLSGSITLAMTNWHEKDKSSVISIMPGDVVLFLNGEFYVEGVTHSWNYGAGGEINLSVSRGGKYENGSFEGEIPNFTSLMALLQKGLDVGGK